MRHTFFLTLSLTVSHLVFAQTSLHSPVAPGAKVHHKGATIEKLEERIHVEDSDARIDELRIGGETQAITVQPKSSMPAYQIAPKTGERSWKILGF